MLVASIDSKKPPKANWAGFPQMVDSVHYQVNLPGTRLKFSTVTPLPINSIKSFGNIAIARARNVVEIVPLSPRKCCSKRWSDPVLIGNYSLFRHQL